MIYLVRSSHMPPFVAPNVVTGELFGRSGSRTTPPARRRKCLTVRQTCTTYSNWSAGSAMAATSPAYLFPGASNFHVSNFKLAAVVENSTLILPQLKSSNSKSTKGERKGANVKLTFVPSRVLFSAAPFVIQLFNQCQTLPPSLPPSPFV